MWPLPPDYMDLTSDGQRKARVNATSIWRGEGATPDDLVASWRFFTDYYLKWPEAYFYDLAPGETEPLPTPWWHYELVRSAGEHRASANAAPRGGAKSTVADSLLLQMGVSGILFKSTLMLATGGMLIPRFIRFKDQIEYNQRIVDDFGRLRPTKGEGAFSSEGVLVLRNRCQILGWAVEGRSRGLRPHFFALDDPEYDPDPSTDMATLRYKFSILLFKKISPMMRKYCPIWWIGTIISKQHLMWQAWEETDPRFGTWKRLRLPAFDESGESLWPEMWPTREELESELGKEVVATEYFNMPGEGSGSTFQFDAKKHGYMIDGPLDLESRFAEDPWSVREGTILEPVKEEDGSWSRRSVPINDWLRNLKLRAMTIDGAPTWGPESDYSAIVVWALDHENRLWVLDCWVNRKPPDQVVEAVWSLAVKWKVSVLGPEAVNIQHTLNHQIATKFHRDAAKLDVVPRMVPIKPTYGYTKPQKIGGLKWRFDYGLIMLPWWRRNELSFQHLFQQVDEFNEGMMNGGLSHDDAIDALAMSQKLIKGRPGASKVEEEPEQTLDAALQRGEFTDAYGNDLRHLVLTYGASPETYEVLLRKTEEEKEVPVDFMGASSDNDSVF